MARGKKKEEESSGSDFTVIFLSLMIILLAFFILLTAQASFEKERIEKALKSIGTGFGMFGMGIGEEQVSEKTLEQRPSLIFINQLRDTVERSILSPEKENEVKLFEDERRLVISINDGALFDPGSGAIHPSLFLLLDGVGELAQSLGAPLNVEGHTDTLGSGKTSNWALSAIRASQVRNYLVQAVGLNPLLINAEGYGPNHPLGDNSTVAGRARNRRVELVFYKNEIDSLEIF